MKLTDAQIALLRTIATGDPAYYQKFLEFRGGRGNRHMVLRALVSRRLATTSGRITVSGYSQFRPNGLCDSGRHGIDFETQPCDLCEKKTKKTREKKPDSDDCYFVVVNDKDGTRVEQMTKDTLLGRMAQNFYGSALLLNEIPRQYRGKLDVPDAGDRTLILIIKGKLVVPEAVQKIVEYTVE